MNINSRKLTRGVTMAIALLTWMTPLSTAAGQWSSSVFGVAEIDTDETLLLLAGLSAGPGGRGLSPRIGVQTYHLSTDAGTSRSSAFVVKPWVGLVNAYEDGSVSGSIGYAFSNRDNPTTIPGTQRGAAVGDQGDGVVVAGGWETYGNTSALATQLLASYNFGSSAVWTRGRATGRLSESEGGSTRLGAELAYLDGDDYRIIQPGAIMEFKRASGASFSVGAGVKLFQAGDKPVYFKVEAGLPLGR